MDFASFSQSLTLMLPRGHVGLFSSWGTEPGYAGMEMTLPLLHAVLLSRPCPARPSTQTLSSAWIFKIFRRNEAEETSRFLYKPSTWIPPLLPVTAGLSPGPLPHNALCSKGLYPNRCSSSPCTTGDWRRLIQPSALVIAVIAFSLQRGATGKLLGQFLRPLLLEASWLLCTELCAKAGQATGCSS